MQASQNQQFQALQGFLHQPSIEQNGYGLSTFQILDSNSFTEFENHGTILSFQQEQFFTLDSSPASNVLVVGDSPVASIDSSNFSLSPQGMLSWMSDSSDNVYGSPASGFSSSAESMKQKLRELEMELLSPESECGNGYNYCLQGGLMQQHSTTRSDWNQLSQMQPNLTLQDILISCAEAVSDTDFDRAAELMNLLEQKVSVSGEPIERLGAYMLEGLRARLEFSGSNIYKALKCEAPIGSDLMTYMGFLYQICPYWRFAYFSANAIIHEAIEFEPRVHIIDFQIAQGTQWIALMRSLASRPGGPPAIRITGVDDPQSAYARGGGLEIVGQKLSQTARDYCIPFAFHDSAMEGCEIKKEHLYLSPGETVVVNFPYVLHHIPDESVSTFNHRDRLLRLVKGLSPKIVTIAEQESNTNTSPFLSRFHETLKYYTAMFESIDVACPRNDRQRINAEQHCVARDIVNMVACEHGDRVERHELHGKWRSRLTMAGFKQQPMGSSAAMAIRDLLKEYNKNFRMEEANGSLYLWWKSRAMATSSAWR